MYHYPNVLEIKCKSAAILHQNKFFWNTAFQQSFCMFMHIKKLVSLWSEKNNEEKCEKLRVDFRLLTNTQNLGIDSSDTKKILKVTSKPSPNNNDNE